MSEEDTVVPSEAWMYSGKKQVDVNSEINSIKRDIHTLRFLAQEIETAQSQIIQNQQKMMEFMNTSHTWQNNAKVGIEETYLMTEKIMKILNLMWYHQSWYDINAEAGVHPRTATL